MQPHNPFPVWKEFIDLRNYRDSIDNAIETITSDFNIKYKVIIEDKVKDTFWKLATLEKPYNPNHWYDVFAVLIGRLISYEIMLKAGRNVEEPYQIHKEWFDYLSKRIIPHESNLPSIFLEKLVSNYPVVDFNLGYSLLRETESLIEEYDLLDVFEDSSSDIHTKIRKFKETYLNFYNLFLSRSEYVGIELSRFEGNKESGRYGNDLYKIFQLNNNNQYSPPEFVKKIILALIHIRNACVHSGIIVLNGNEVQIIDKKTNGTVTFNEKIEINQIPLFFHRLLSIDKEFENISLLLYVNRWIRELTQLYNRYFTCNDCGEISIYFVPPETQYIICRKCKMIHFINRPKF